MTFCRSKRGDNPVYEVFIKKFWKKFLGIFIVMKKFIITEEERKHIKGLYEQESNDTQKDFFKACLGYVEEVLSKDPNYKTDIDFRGRLANVKKYFQSKRDSLTPNQLSQEENGIVKSVMTSVNGLVQDGKQQEMDNLIRVGGGDFKSDVVGI
jgi:hypothetical protein